MQALRLLPWPAVLFMAGVVLPGASCNERCAEGSEQRDGACVRVCNSTADCGRSEACVDGACFPASAGSSSGGGVSTSTSAAGSSSSAGAVSSGLVSSSSSQAPASDDTSSMSSSSSVASSVSPASSTGNLSSWFHASSFSAASSTAASGSSATVPSSVMTSASSAGTSSSSTVEPPPIRLRRMLRAAVVMDGPSATAPVAVDPARSLLFFHAVVNDQRPGCMMIMGELRLGIGGVEVAFTRAGDGAMPACPGADIVFHVVEFEAGARVQRGVTDLPNSMMGPLVVPLTMPVDRARSMVLHTTLAEGNIFSTNDLVASSLALQGDGVVLHAAMFPTELQRRVSWQVVQWDGARVFQGTLSFMSNSVAVARSWPTDAPRSGPITLFGSHRATEDGDLYLPGAAMMMRGLAEDWGSDMPRIRFERVAGGAPMAVEYALVAWPAGVSTAFAEVLVQDNSTTGNAALPLLPSPLCLLGPPHGMGTHSSASGNAQPMRAMGLAACEGGQLSVRRGTAGGTARFTGWAVDFGTATNP